MHAAWLFTAVLAFRRVGATYAHPSQSGILLSFTLNQHRAKYGVKKMKKYQQMSLSSTSSIKNALQGMSLSSSSLPSTASLDASLSSSSIFQSQQQQHHFHQSQQALQNLTLSMTKQNSMPSMSKQSSLSDVASKPISQPVTGSGLRKSATETSMAAVKEEESHESVSASPLALPRYAEEQPTEGDPPTSTSHEPSPSLSISTHLTHVQSEPRVSTPVSEHPKHQEVEGDGSVQTIVQTQTTTTALVATVEDTSSTSLGSQASPSGFDGCDMSNDKVTINVPLLSTLKRARSLSKHALDSNETEYITESTFSRTQVDPHPTHGTILMPFSSAA